MPATNENRFEEIKKLAQKYNGAKSFVEEKYSVIVFKSIKKWILIAILALSLFLGLMIWSNTTLFSQFVVGILIFVSITVCLFIYESPESKVSKFIIRAYSYIFWQFTKDKEVLIMKVEAYAKIRLLPREEIYAMVNSKMWALDGIDALKIAEMPIKNVGEEK